MRLLFVFIFVAGCGADSSSDSGVGPMTLTYLTGTETVSILTCNVSRDNVVEITQELDISPAELSALGAVCEGKNCRISKNFETQHVMCGTQEIYKGVTHRVAFKLFYDPL